MVTLSGSRMRWVFFLVGLFFIGMCPFVSPSPPEEKDVDQSRLPRILDEIAAYCQIFANASLNYICLEEISEIIYSPYRRMPRIFDDPPYTIQKNHYLYDYQLIQKEHDVKEQRILLEENGVKMEIQDAPLKVKGFSYKYIILGPLLMNEYWQLFHDYRIIGRAKVHKEDCLVIEAVPKAAMKSGHLFGKLWVSERDSKVWRMEWYQESIDNYEEIEKTAKTLKARPQVKLILELGFEEKGIRFPSQYIESEEYVNLRGALLIRSETTVNYRNYKFFTVETEVEIKKGTDNLP